MNEAQVTEAETVTIDLWDGEPGNGGTMLAGSTGLEDLAGLGSGWLDAFWAPVPTVAGTTYWLTAFGGNDAPDLAIGCSNDPNSYATGGAFTDFSSDETAPYTDFSTAVDLTFRTYTNLGAVTPEPATMPLLATGLIGMFGAGVRRRKRRG